MRLYPIIILSLEGAGGATSEYILKQNNERADFKRNKLFRVIEVNNKGRFQCNEKSFDSGLDISKGSKENFIALTNNRSDFFSFFNEIIFDIFNIGNINEFTAKGIQFNREPTILVIGSVSHPFLAVLNKILLTNRESISAHSLCPMHTICLLQKESFQKNKRKSILSNSLFQGDR